MPKRIAINGFGRIGRLTFRNLIENPEVEVVAINDLTDNETLAHLLKYDTAHGPFKGTVSATDEHLIVNGKHILASAIKDPTTLPWKENNIDVVLECTGIFTSAEKAGKHLEAGAKKVVISAPAKGDIKTIVLGVNDDEIADGITIYSNASCTTNCLAPLVKPLYDNLGVESGLMTTIHAYTNDQVLTDVYHTDLRRARSATQSMIPTKTGAAAAVGLVLPELNGKLDGFAMRVPTINVSIVDLSFIAGRATSVDEVNSILKAASEGELKGILGYNTEPLVSMDFNHDPRSSVFDATQTKVIGSLVKVLSWYDNEWGFSNRMLDTTQALMNAR